MELVLYALRVGLGAPARWLYIRDPFMIMMKSRLGLVHCIKKTCGQADGASEGLVGLLC